MLSDAPLELFETDFLVPLDTTLAHPIASKYPFIQVEGALNFRELGGLPIAGAPTLQTRPGLIFRSGQISALTDNGKGTLRSLGVQTVFDFRSAREFEKYDAPIPSIPGIEIHHVPIFDEKAFTPEETLKRQNLYGEGKEGFISAYRDIMDHGGPAFAKVIRQVIARPEVPVLFHCAVGKDRTGLLAALMLMVAGVDDAIIAYDYGLTRVGLDIKRNIILPHFAELIQRNPDACSTMLGSRPSIMHEMLDIIRRDYGGAEEYLRVHGGLTTDELDIFRSVFVVANGSA